MPDANTHSDKSALPTDHAAFGCPLCGGAGCEDCDGTGQRIVTALQVDGNFVMVHGNKPLSDQARAALAEVYRAALERMSSDE